MNEKTKKTLERIFRIVLIIIIILLFIHNCNLRKQQKDSEKNRPTGNVQIIEIICEDDACVDDTMKIDDGKDKGSRGTTNNTGTGDNTETTDKLIIRDKDVKWDGTTDVYIFRNSMYAIDDLIAPESYNTYQFVIKNGTDYNIKYMISFVETNPYNINMKYKLKKNDDYLIDHYVSASELNTAEINLSGNSSDTFYLEWKWISSSNDTEIGADPESYYGLKIDVKAESNNG